MGNIADETSWLFTFLNPWKLRPEAVSCHLCFDVAHFSPCLHTYATCTPWHSSRHSLPEVEDSTSTERWEDKERLSWHACCLLSVNHRRNFLLSAFRELRLEQRLNSPVAFESGEETVFFFFFLHLMRHTLSNTIKTRKSWDQQNYLPHAVLCIIVKTECFEKPRCGQQ